MPRIPSLPDAVLRVAAAGLLALVPAAAAAQSDHASGAASAQIVAPLTVTGQTDLDFGTVVSSAQAGTVTVSATGATSIAGGVRAVCCAVARPATFLVDGEPGRAYTVSVPADILAQGTATRGPAPPDLLVSDITISTASRPADNEGGVLDVAGRDSFSVGGTLHLPGNVPPAQYRATVPVVVIYG